MSDRKIARAVQKNMQNSYTLHTDPPNVKTLHSQICSHFLYLPLSLNTHTIYCKYTYLYFLKIRSLIYKHSIPIKIRKIKMLRYYKSFLNFINYSNHVLHRKKITLRHCIQLECLLSHLQSGIVPQSLSLTTLIFLKIIGQSLCGMSFSLGLPNVSS